MRYETSVGGLVKGKFQRWKQRDYWHEIGLHAQSKSYRENIQYIDYSYCERLPIYIRVGRPRPWRAQGMDSVQRRGTVGGLELSTSSGLASPSLACLRG